MRQFTYDGCGAVNDPDGRNVCYVGSVTRAIEVCAQLNAEFSRRWRFGYLIRKESAWVGVHYSPHNKRWCINLIPFVTFWITKPGGNVP